jgi:hypothetical protein
MGAKTSSRSGHGLTLERMRVQSTDGERSHEQHGEEMAVPPHKGSRKIDRLLYVSLVLDCCGIDE